MALYPMALHPVGQVEPTKISCQAGDRVTYEDGKLVCRKPAVNQMMRDSWPIWVGLGAVLAVGIYLELRVIKAAEKYVDKK